MTVSAMPEAQNRQKAGRPGIVHIGIGAFHRAHQAVYTDAAMKAQGGDWQIIGVSLRSTDIVDALNAQNGEFTVVERHSDGPKAYRITSMSEALAAARDIQPVLDALADPAIRIITITVTEKAYGIDRVSGRVVPEHPSIKYDLASPRQPAGLLGLLVEGLRLRKQAGLPPFTVVSCDNLPSNGVLLRTGVIDFAKRIDKELAEWIAQTVSFPSTMVDRITPASTAATYADAKLLLGFEDPAAVETEPFSQWVIEDDFPNGRPAWEAGGAVMVDDVEPYERMKLRMLNGSHSLIAYMGQLGGYRYVRDVMADAGLSRLIVRHMENAAATMQPLAGIDFTQYAEDLLARFRNPEIAHEIRQIAMDGTEKLPQRIFAPACDLPRGSVELGTFALCFAAWMAVARQHLNEVEPSTAAEILNDPRADEIIHALGNNQDTASIYDRLAMLPDWMPKQLLSDPLWRDGVIARLSVLLSDGVAEAIGHELKP
ncbi:mannitol dehydrogenase family protein [Thalassospira lucentensis]|uniref:mannitol dehydrogenase family protein n=1 Tax=Thalassospira lucentensis TaxID=168935 RepID=UPI0003B69351|nr:mannitol dehydrogenase family protein [Thalassospira lucentensis]